jgi:RNA ligase (TIGR02306 family)
MTPLASIQRITKLTPIANADKIELASILGFKTVVKKGEFQEGSLVVFHVPDTKVNAENPKYSFLAKQDFRIKISKFKGHYSQGLAMPLSSFMLYSADLVEGTDVTDTVGITKYEKPLPEGTQAIGHLPSFLKKTDEPNLLTAPEILDAFMGKICYITRKMDGQSGTFFLNDGAFGICSRNLQIDPASNNAFTQIARDFSFEQIMRADGRNIAVQGEVYGPGIQKNAMGAPKKSIQLFNLFDIGERKYMDAGRLLDFCQRHKLPIVETLWSGEFRFTLDELQEMADEGRYSNGSAAEGIVIRPVRETLLDNGERLSAKVISQKFLAKHGE